MGHIAWPSWDRGVGVLEDSLNGFVNVRNDRVRREHGNCAAVRRETGQFLTTGTGAEAGAFGQPDTPSFPASLRQGRSLIPHDLGQVAGVRDEDHAIANIIPLGRSCKRSR